MKPETRFIKAVHKHLPDTVYAEKLSNPYRGGAPDCVYLKKGGGTTWIEYKYHEQLPKKVKPNLSELQKKWLKRAHDLGHEVYVVLGFKHEGKFRAMVYTDPKSWNRELAASTVLKRSIPIEEMF